MFEELIKKLRYCANAISCLHCPYWKGCGGSKEDLGHAADSIEELQKCIDGISADNDHLCEKIGELSKERKTGKWEHDGSNWENRFICSACGHKLFEPPTNYCPKCGAKMGDTVEWTPQAEPPKEE